MKVVVDTPIWSLALRRKTAASKEAKALQGLWNAGDAVLLGPVRQEILSGVREPQQFARLREQLRVEPDHPLTTAHFERAAELYNLCRSKGVQGSNVDYLICSVAITEGFKVFTADSDFARYARHVPIEFFRVE